MCTTLQMMWVGGTTEAVWGVEVVAAVAGQASNRSCLVQALHCSDATLAGSGPAHDASYIWRSIRSNDVWVVAVNGI